MMLIMPEKTVALFGFAMFVYKTISEIVFAIIMLNILWYTSRKPA